MSVPNDALETHPPVAYPQFRDLIRDGDIVLCQGNDPFSRLIQWSTKSPWSHVAMAFRVDSLDRVIVVESVEKIGVRAVSLSDFLSRDSEGTSPYPGRILLARHDQLNGEVSDPAVRELAKFAFGHIGCKFDPVGIARIAMRIADARLFGNRRTPKLLAPRDDEFICSEFVAAAYERARLKVPWDGLGFIAPCDIADDEHLSPVAQADVKHPPRPPKK
ncbi:MAG TPA: YiiX/YebB-like N1pC/P60 family cysteine hydrolase [Caulobacteraceae bacterium]|nr:YiiX/YebB-like N1pC/P60 family cysteine hydrolase [Caulobacteraceae bacterium]